mgnify:CR=1 FL=1
MQKFKFSYFFWVLIITIFFPVATAHVHAEIKVEADSSGNRDEAITPIMALNYCNFSLLTIIEYNDRIILDQEYNNIINRINLSLIKDEEIFLFSDPCCCEVSSSEDGTGVDPSKIPPSITVCEVFEVSPIPSNIPPEVVG